MKLKTLVLGSYQTNCYIVQDEHKHCIIIDPGSIGRKIVNYLNENELMVDAILLTHGHHDHIGAVDYVYKQYPCPIYCHQETIEMIVQPSLNLSCHGNSFVVESPTLEAPTYFTIGSFDIEWMFLPGHCQGSSMIRFVKENIIFSGDVLFQGSIGRFDFPSSSKHDTIQSIQKMKSLDYDAVVYPGHGPSTTLKQEQETNPYF
ncbi:MBL fold metallo-hydrolase [Tannockella kyphosi]|uniref:MBL fold metallo-hydrolase n=1 Tax=Tannockella kyphosi TaxID=2899121 RepID=UPI00201390B9|nr:MBL fold metallo-hydrolase [Tannockella kyphosi]